MPTVLLSRSVVAREPWVIMRNCRWRQVFATRCETSRGKLVKGCSSVHRSKKRRAGGCEPNPRLTQRALTRAPLTGQ
jgi:hypothetical protein